MVRRWLTVAALPATLFLVDAAVGSEHAAPAAGPSLLALPAVSSGPQLSATTFEAIRHRPRRWRDRDRDRDDRWERSRRSSTDGFAQIHGGFFDPDGDPPSSFLGGVRAGANIDDRFQVGFGIDWNHRSDRQTTVVQSIPLPDGSTAERQVVLAQSSANLIPMMAFIQLSPGIHLPFSPYFGAGAGYQMLFLSAEDFDSGADFDATYSGWGWQLWGGASIPLSGNARFAAEAFVNGAELERDVRDETTGDELREIVPQDGIGMRLGFNWGF